MVYYLCIPRGKYMNTPYEYENIVYSDNEFIFKEYLRHILPIIDAFEEVSLYSYSAPSEKEFYKIVETEMDIGLTVNHKLEVYESVNDPNITLYVTTLQNESLCEYDYEDPVYLFSEHLWNLVEWLKLNESVVRFPKELRTMINMLYTEYRVLLPVLYLEPNYTEVNQTIWNAVSRFLEKKTHNANNVDILDVLDLTMLHYKLLSGGVDM